jgi:hypothetical protein
MKNNLLNVEPKRLKDLVGEIKIEGEVVSFKKFIQETAGSGEIYEDYIERIINEAVAKNVDWADVDDYLCPIVHEIVADAAELDQDVYLELVTAIQSAYKKLKAIYKENRCKEEADSEYLLDRDSDDFFLKFDGLIHELASGRRVIKEFDNQPLGKYRVVVGLPNTEVEGDQTPAPLIEGINPYNRLEDEGDFYHAVMDVCIDVERANIDHVIAVDRIMDITQIYYAKRALKKNDGGVEA